MAKILLSLVAVVAVGGGGYYVYQNTDMSMMAQQEVAADMGTYSYECDERVAFDATISADLGTIMLKASGEGTYPPATTLVKVAGSNRYVGDGIVLVGNGETVTLNPDDEAVINCSPVPSSENAPFNWGDAEATGSADVSGNANVEVGANVAVNADVNGSVKPDTTLVVTETIEGKWKSTQDPKSVREFKSGGVVVEWYDNEIVSEGKYVVYTKTNAPKLIAFPLDTNAVYVQLTEKGTQADTLDFKVTKLTETQLVMTYMTRGGVQSYTRVQ